MEGGRKGRVGGVKGEEWRGGVKGGGMGGGVKGGGGKGPNTLK